MRTNMDELARILAPAVQATVPGSALRRSQRIDAAIDESGNIRPRAIRADTWMDSDFDSSSATLASSDTVNAVAYMSTTIQLPSGAWWVKAWGGLTGRLSTSSNMNGIVALNGIQSSNYQVPLSSGDTGVVWPSMILEDVSGEVMLDLMMRPSAGTLTIEAGYWQYKIRRLRG